MSGKGKARLTAYVTLTQGKLDKLGDDVDESKLKSIVASVVNSIKGLSAGAPEELRTQLKEALDNAGCLDGPGPNPEATVDQLKEGVNAVATVLGIEEDEDEAPPEVDVEPGDETDTLVGVVDRLWDIEEPYRMKIGEDIKLSVQRKAEYDAIQNGQLVDNATEPLFEYVDKSKFSDVDHAFMALLDNYKREGDEKEVVTSQERSEMSRFLDLMDDTPHMRYVHKVLVKWGLAPGKLSTFMASVYEAWFTNYYHGKSSGFEHVFVGEEKRKEGKSEIIGLHNWIQFAREESRGNMNYLGYAHKGSSDGTIVTVKFAWTDDDPEVEVKTCSTFLVGTSIAFEFAMACLIFFGGKDGDKPWIKLGGHDCQVTVYKVQDHMGEFVRTIFIE